jgi:hypothetical protein
MAGALMTLWLCGKWVPDDQWEFQGLFDTKDAAIAACRDRNYFVTQITLNQEEPDAREVFVDAFYPRAEAT